MSRSVYDEVYEICRDNDKLITRLIIKELLIDYQDILCDRCCEGYFHLVKDNSYPSDKVVYTGASTGGVTISNRLVIAVGFLVLIFLLNKF